MAGPTPLPAQAPAAAPPPSAQPDFSGASFDTLIRAAAKGLQSDESIIQQMKDSAAAERDVAKQVGAIKLPDPPVAPPLPPPPQPQFHSPMDEFGSLASALAIFGSLLTRHPLTSALNGSAAAMNAIRQGDFQNYRMSMDNWKTQTDYAMKIADYQNQRYQQILDNTKFTIQQKQWMLGFETQANQDLVAASKLRSDGIDGLANLLMNRTRLQIAMARAAEGVKVKWSPLNDAYMSAIEDFKKQNGRDPTGQEKIQIYRSLSGQTASGVKETAADLRIKDDIKSAVSATQQALSDVAEAPASVGAAGEVARPLQGIKGWFTGQPSIAKDFESQITQVQNILKRLTQSGQMTPAQTERLDVVVRGLGLTDNPADARQSLRNALKALTEIGGGYYVEPGTVDGDYIAPNGGDANDPGTWVQRQAQ